MKEGVNTDGAESRVIIVMFHSHFLLIFNIGGVYYGLIVLFNDMAFLCYGFMKRTENVYGITCYDIS